MLDPKYIRDNAAQVKKNTEERAMDSSVVDKWLEVDETLRAAKQDIEELNRRRNEIAEMLKDDSKRTPEAIQEGKEIKEQISPLEEILKTLDTQWNELMAQIPNLHPQDVPIGRGESDNKVLREVGDKPNFDFEPKGHLEIGEALGIIDFEAGAKVSGSQFYFLKGDAVRLEFALIQYGLEKFTEKGYELISTPDLAKSRFYLGTGYAPKGDEAQIYEIEGEDLGLIATAEVTMAGYFADEVLSAKDLPKKYAAISHCYRKEGGAYGKYSKGLYRVHQFSKLEMFAYSKPEESETIHEEFLKIEEEIVQDLGIPYRVLEMCTGDLGAIAAKKYDLEAWMPGRGDYGEITSTSNCTDFQARSMNIKYKNDKGENEYVHMLNGTAVVMSRFPIAILENFQQADGTVKVPEVLRKYMGKDFIGKS